MPPKEGGPIAMFHLAHALLSEGHSVDVLAIETPKYPVVHDEVKKHVSNSYTYSSVFVNTNIQFHSAIISFIRNAPYHIERFDNTSMHQTLISILQKKKYDIVLFETLYMTPYLSTVKKYSDAKCILRSHNIEHQIWKRLRDNEQNIFKKMYLTQLTYALKKYELTHLHKFDAIACISKGEVAYYTSFVKQKKIEVVPFGIEIQSKHHSDNTKDFYHIGSMDWRPNIEGVEWFINQVIPQLDTTKSNFKTYLAGRNMPVWLSSMKHPLLDIVGEVDDIATFLHDKAVLVVPLFSGSGIRIKIIEAMSLGKIVISTSIGAEGIAYQHGKNILIADTAETFAETMIQVSQDIDRYRKIGAEAKKIIEQQHSYSKVLESFNALLRL
jgi:glycosyltransferase involved in cell wall biosynthesis